MSKITSKDIQEASNLFQVFLKEIVKRYNDSLLSVYQPDNKIIATKHGLKYLGSGCYRVAYKYKNLVLKTHLFEGCSCYITEEHDLWNKNKKSLNAAFLNPVLFCKKMRIRNSTVAFSISPYVIPHTKSKKTQRHTRYNYFRYLASETIYDGHSGNIGIINKLPVLIDYQDDIIKNDFDELSKKDLITLKKQRLSLLKICSKAKT